MSAEWRKTAFLLAGAALAVLLALYALSLTRTEHGAGPGAPPPRSLLDAAATAGGHPAFSKLTLTSGPDTTVLERQPDGRWWLQTPAHARADSAAVEEVLSALETSKVRATLETQPTPEELGRYGLSPPRFSVEAQSSTGQRVGLQGGVENPFDGSVYARKVGVAAVFTLEGSVGIALRKTPFELRDKHVLEVPLETLQRIEAHGRSKGFILERVTPKAWQLGGAHPRPAAARAVSRILEALQSTAALSFPGDSSAFRSANGLAPPAVEVTLVRRQGDPVRLRFGRSPAAAEPHGYVLREESGREELAEVPVEAMQPFEVSSDELADASLLRFSPEEVWEVSFQTGSAPAVRVVRTLAEGGHEAWTLFEPIRAPAKRWKMASVLWTLGHLTPLPSPAHGGVSAARTGVGAQVVVLRGQDGGELARLELGDEPADEPGHRYARVPRGPPVLLDAARLQALPRTPADLLETTDADAGASAP